MTDVLCATPDSLHNAHTMARALSVLLVEHDSADAERMLDALRAGGFEPTSAEVVLVPQTTVRLRGAKAARMLRLYEVLDEYDDVKHVYANFDISEEEMVQAAQAG